MLEYNGQKIRLHRSPPKTPKVANLSTPLESTQALRPIYPYKLPKACPKLSMNPLQPLKDH